MSTEPEGVSPATAGGASVPEPFRRMFWIAAEDIANKIGCTVVEGAPRGYGASEPSDSEAGKLRTISNALHATLGEGDCVERTVTLGHVWYLARLVEGHLDVISDRNRRQEPDPRDAEIERLRKDCADNAEEWKLADAEVTRLKREADQQLKYYGGLVNRIHEALGDDRRVEVANRGGLANAVLRLAHAFSGVTAERDRLRAELGRIGERQPKFQPGQRVRVGLCDGIVITPKDTTRVQFEGMLHTFDIPTRDVHAIDDIAPAEPRRWAAGDPEPEVGTTVQTARGGVYIRLRSGYWHRTDDCVHDDPSNCIEAGYSWTWLTGHTEHLPLIEVVRSDG